MATTLQEALNVATKQELALDGDTLIQDDREIIEFVQDFMQGIFQQLAAFIPYYYAREAADLQTTATQPRTVDLTELGTSEPLIEALRRIQFNSSDDSNETEIYSVAEELRGSQPPPRFYLRGNVLYEIVPDWNDHVAASGEIGLDVLYTRQPSVLDVEGNLTQNIDRPDNWTRPLEDAITGYLVRKDERDPSMWFEAAANGVTQLRAHLAQMHGIALETPGAAV